MLMTSVSGCGTFLYFFWPFGRTVTIPAEYDGLANHTVAVVIYADEQTQYEYPWVMLNLSARISGRLQEKLENVTTVDARKITAYQRQNLHWTAMDKTELGKALKADFVLHVSLVEFSTAAKGFGETLHGTINGEVKLYDCSEPEIDSLVWTTQNIEIEFPKTPTIRTAKKEAEIRSIIQAMFADKLAKKFYSYKVDREDL